MNWGRKSLCFVLPEGSDRERKKEKKNKWWRKSFELNRGNGQYNFIAEVVRSLTYTYREFVNYRLPFYLTTRKLFCQGESPYPVARWLQAESEVIGRPRLISPLFLCPMPIFFFLFDPPPFAFSPCRTTSSTSYKAKVFYQRGRTVKWKKKKEENCRWCISSRVAICDHDSTG